MLYRDEIVSRASHLRRSVSMFKFLAVGGNPSLWVEALLELELYNNLYLRYYLTPSRYAFEDAKFSKALDFSS